jgi:hypothetical protein
MRRWSRPFRRFVDKFAGRDVYGQLTPDMKHGAVGTLAGLLPALTTESGAESEAREVTIALTLH